VTIAAAPKILVSLSCTHLQKRHMYKSLIFIKKRPTKETSTKDVVTRSVAVTHMMAPKIFVSLSCTLTPCEMT